MDTFLNLLFDHVYLILFFSLILEFVGIPIPGETMMALAGVMGYNGHAEYFLMIIAGSLGTVIGMQLSYEVGRRLGNRAVRKYGKYMGLTKNRMEQANKFFNKYGSIVIFVAYYLPGVRHILGYFSGISKIDSKKFHIYSTIGGIFWVFTFITMGYILGPSWKYVFNIMHKYGLILLILSAISLFIYLIYKKLGKDEFILDLRKYLKYYVPFIFVLLFTNIFFMFKANKHFSDEIMLISLILTLILVLIIYIKVSAKNRTSKKLLLVVDYQKDFVDGALGFDGAEKLEVVIKEKIEKYLENNQDIIFTLDTHDEDYLETREGKFLPVIHCQSNTEGHNLYGDIKNYKYKAKKIFEKSTFGSVDLAKYVKKSNYEYIEVCGLVSNICVLSNIILIQNFNENVEIYVDLKSTLSYEETINTNFESYLRTIGVKIIQ